MFNKGKEEPEPRTTPPDDPILTEPVLDSADTLLRLIRELRGRFAGGDTKNVLFSGPRIVNWLWEAMRNLDGVIPSQPPTPQLTEAEAFVECMIKGEHYQQLREAIDQVANWCYQNGAKRGGAVNGSVPSEQDAADKGGPEGRGTSPAGHRRDAADRPAARRKKLTASCMRIGAPPTTRRG